MDELADRYPTLNAGALCLDFANTLEPGAATGRDRDHLGGHKRHADFAGLLAWSEYANVVDNGIGRRLTVLAELHPVRAKRVVRLATELRAATRAVFAAAAFGDDLPIEPMHVLHKHYAGAVAAARLITGPHRVGWDWMNPDDLAGPLRPIAASAIDLLTGPRLDRVKECSGDRCWVLFVDTTKNNSRRWCQMRYCGNLEKSHRQAARRRQLRAERQRSGTTRG